MTEVAIARNDCFVEDEAATTQSGISLASPQLVLTAELTASSESQFFAGLTGDIARGGVFVETYQQVAIGRPAKVRLSIPTGDVEILGVVDWVRDAFDGANPGVGVAFGYLSPEARAAIEAFCALRAPLYHESADE